MNKDTKDPKPKGARRRVFAPRPAARASQHPVGDDSQTPGVAIPTVTLTWTPVQVQDMVGALMEAQDLEKANISRFAAQGDAFRANQSEEKLARIKAMLVQLLDLWRGI